MEFRFKRFKVYGDAKEFAKYCRKITLNNIRNGDRNLSEQILRASNSIILNIAEGSAGGSDAEFSRFLGIAIRSVYEVVAGFDLALSYNLIDEKLNSTIEEEAEKILTQLSALRNSVIKK